METPSVNMSAYTGMPWAISVSWVIDQGWRGMLVCFAIENCAKLFKTKYLATLRRRFEVCLPFFRIEIQKHCLSELFP